jgi:hypothetical protein
VGITEGLHRCVGEAADGFSAATAMRASIDRLMA